MNELLRRLEQYMTGSTLSASLRKRALLVGAGRYITEPNTSPNAINFGHLTG